MKVRLALVLLLFLVGTSAFAEYPRYRAAVIGEIAAGNNTGYVFPFLGVGVGMEVQTMNLFIQTDMMYSRTDKFSYKNLEQAYGATHCLVWLGKSKRFGIGGGATYSLLVFHELGVTRSAVRLLALVGYRTGGKFIVAGKWVFPGLDKAYRVHRPVLNMETGGGDHFRLVVKFSYPMFENRSGSYQHAGPEASMYLKFLP